LLMEGKSFANRRVRMFGEGLNSSVQFAFRKRKAQKENRREASFVPTLAIPGSLGAGR
jgi:hypothetical protein